MDQYKYRALNANGRQVKGMVAAKNEYDLYEQLQTVGLELIQCKVVGESKGSQLFSGLRNRIVVRDLIQLFINLEQMQKAGVPLLEALADIRDASDNDQMRDIMSEVYRHVSDGLSLSEALNKFPKVFKPLHLSLIKAGEDTGDLTTSYSRLVVYLKWADNMQIKIKKATRYPSVIFVVVLLVIVVMMGYVVPQIIGFITNLEQELPFFTVALVATSDFFKEYWWLVLSTPVVVVSIVAALRQSSAAFAYKVDAFLINMPLLGEIFRKITIARYAQTFSSLYASGIDVIGALKSARNTATNLVMIEAFKSVEAGVSTGAALSEAFDSSGEFPSMVVRMVKVGEDSGNLNATLDQVTEFYTRDVDESVEGLITFIEPLLTAVLGIVILWIAVAVFGPIYSSFENIDM
jgi:type IV pilus assembly protein PilC